MALELVKLLIMSVVLIYASVSDIKTMTAPNKIYPILLTAGFLNFEISSLWGALIVFVVSMSVALVGNMGGADVKIMSCCAFIVKGFDGIYAMLIACIIAVFIMSLIKLFKMGKEFPFIPFIAMGFISVFAMKIINIYFI